MFSLRCNTATGFEALFTNTAGLANTATGARALFKNTNGAGNTATGFEALLNNTGPGTNEHSIAGTENTAMGDSTLHLNNDGAENTAIGGNALNSNVSGNFNTACGYGALSSSGTDGNTAVGAKALINAVGFNNTALGSFAGFNLTTGDNNIYIGSSGVAGDSNHIRIGTVGTQTATFIAGIHNAALSGSPVVVNSSGQLGVSTSSARFKEAIKPMDKASEAILALRPVTFRYKKDIDPDRIPQFGLVAEEVEKVNPDLVARDENGQVYTVRYEAVNTMLLNEFLKEHRKVEEQDCKVEEQEATIAQLKSTVAQQQKDFQATGARQQKQIEALTAGLQKVSAQVEISRPAPQMVLNNE